MEEILMRSANIGADVIVFDEELSPAQLKNISALTDLKVIDRNQLILDIFATKAKTSEAKVQVELAQLKYIFPRLAEKNTAFSRLTGGIGGRGPGETKLEIDRRRIRERIALLEERLEEIRKVRETKRSKRKGSSLPLVSIVGYANSGKSSLLNLLTRSNVDVDKRPFSTLSPTARLIKYPERKRIILSDTVGLIRDLPETLFNAFLSTFEELSYADLLLHLVDISDCDIEEKIESVEEILKRLKISDKKKLIVFNKIDRLREEDLPSLKNLERRYNAVSISCLEKKGIDLLVKRIAEELEGLS
jgi:GTP-binding protein HflX